MLGTYKKGPVCGMRAALSRRHVHGLRFQPPATGGVHRIAGGVAQEPADAECRHAAARVAIAPPENPRLHFVYMYEIAEDEVRYRCGLVGAPVGQCLMSNIIRVVRPDEEGISI